MSEQTGDRIAAPTSPRARLVVVGGGMAAHRLVEALVARQGTHGAGEWPGADTPPTAGEWPGADTPPTAGEWHITVLAEEPRAPYDRVALTQYFSGRRPEDLALGDPRLWQDRRVTLRRGERAVAIDRQARTVTTATDHVYAYDALVLASGSSPFVPPVPGRDLQGCFVYRTIDDVAALRQHVEQVRGRPDGAPAGPVSGVVVGGGLLGLEAAGALTALGVRTHVVELADRLMPLQLDEGGGESLRRLIEGIGVTVHTGTATQRCVATARGTVGGVCLADGRRLDADVVVFAAGVRPRDELARDAGLPVGERGGVLVDPTCRTPDPRIWAVGEVAAVDGRCFGLVAPGYAMAEVVADRLLGGGATFPGADLSTKLKLLGVDVASFGDPFGRAQGALSVVYADPVAGTYKKLVLSDDARVLLGGVLVGDATAYAVLRSLLDRPLDGDPARWLLPAGDGEAPTVRLPDDATVCTCHNVSAGRLRRVVTGGDGPGGDGPGGDGPGGCADLGSLSRRTGAGTGCGSCLPLVKRIMTAELEAAGVEVSRSLCEHFDVSRAQLFDIVRVSGIRTFSGLIARHGRGRGCDICKPVVASILASLGSGHILDGEQATLQDTNDHVLANLQKDGTYSVVPRIPGGEVTPEGLITIGEVAREFGLYTKITGGQRIDLFGARIEQLPLIWKRLVEAGFESGHAYGKAVRTVKSCVGSTWCRYGVQDSVGLAIALELRYRGLRSPHKLKLGVSGCARECAEARAKDVGVIATEQGWNLYVGGNGGFTPRHARLLAEDLDTPTLTRTIDRFLMYYVRTADRLQRTASWLEDIEGGLDHVRAVVLDDALGIADDLDAAMAAHVAGYSDEWRVTLGDPVRLQRFESFVNAPDRPDPDLVHVQERGQPRPASAAERAAEGPPLPGGPPAGADGVPGAGGPPPADVVAAPDPRVPASGRP